QARAAPGSPEIDDHNSSSELLDRDLCSLDRVVELEVEWLANRRLAAPATANSLGNHRGGEFFENPVLDFESRFVISDLLGGHPQHKGATNVFRCKLNRIGATRCHMVS